MMASEFAKIAAELKRARGIDVEGYRPNMLRRRIGVRMGKVRVDDPAAYLALLESNPDECDRLMDAIAINVSSFFRNPVVFELLAQYVLPEIVERKQKRGVREIRVWSAGVASGEEAYSLAILVHQALKGQAEKWRPLIFGTDIDGDALKAAARGSYPRDSFADTKLAVLDQYFIPIEAGYRTRPFLRKLVRFSRHDLTAGDLIAPSDSVFGGFDLILLRNVLIYFSRELQARVLERVRKALGRGGYLVLGAAESLEPAMASRFFTIDRRNRIFRLR